MTARVSLITCQSLTVRSLISLSNALKMTRHLFILFTRENLGLDPNTPMPQVWQSHANCSSRGVVTVSPVSSFSIFSAVACIIFNSFGSQLLCLNSCQQASGREPVA